MAEMNQYQVSVMMVEETEDSPQKLSIEVKGKSGTEDDDESRINNNIVNDMFKSHEYVKIFEFDILDPEDCLVNVESIKGKEKVVQSNQQQQLTTKKAVPVAFPKNPAHEPAKQVTFAVDTEEQIAEESVIDGKSVHVLHVHEKKKARSAQRSAATDGVVGGGGVSSGSEEDELDINANSQDDLFHIYAGSEKEYSLAINLNELKNADGVVFFVDTNFESASSAQSLTEGKTTSRPSASISKINQGIDDSLDLDGKEASIVNVNAEAKEDELSLLQLNDGPCPPSNILEVEAQVNNDININDHVNLNDTNNNEELTMRNTMANIRAEIESTTETTTTVDCQPSNGNLDLQSTAAAGDVITTVQPEIVQKDDVLTPKHPPIKFMVEIEGHMQITFLMNRTKRPGPTVRMNGPSDSLPSIIPSGIDSEFLMSSRIARRQPRTEAEIASAQADYYKSALATKRRPGKTEIFKKLICERLHALGISYDEAFCITDSWSNGYVQHRRLSLRIPNVRKLRSKRQEGLATIPEEEPCQTSTAATSPITHSPLTAATFAGLKLHTPTSTLPPPQQPTPTNLIQTAHSMLHIMETITGILNSACCTLIEAKYFLLLPHLNLTEPTISSLSGGGHDFKYKSDFMYGWIDIIQLAAYQINPVDLPSSSASTSNNNTTSSITTLINNELQPLKKNMKKLNSTTKEVDKNLKSLQFYIEQFRIKLITKLQENCGGPGGTGTAAAEFTQAAAIAKNKQQRSKFIMKKSTDYLEMLNFSPAEIFENYLYIRIATDYGLYLKTDENQLWASFSGLNSLERRVVFMGIVDHAQTTINSLDVTLKHIKELYTGGYPTSITRRLDCLCAVLCTEYQQIIQLPINLKLELYEKIDGILCAMERFQFIFHGLASKINDGKKACKKMQFDAKKAIQFIKMKSVERNLTQIIVPFGTLPLKQFGVKKNKNNNGRPQFVIAREPFPEDVLGND